MDNREQEVQAVRDAGEPVELPEWDVQLIDRSFARIWFGQAFPLISSTSDLGLEILRSLSRWYCRERHLLAEISLRRQVERERDKRDEAVELLSKAWKRAMRRAEAAEQALAAARAGEGRTYEDGVMAALHAVGNVQLGSMRAAYFLAVKDLLPSQAAPTQEVEHAGE